MILEVVRIFEDGKTHHVNDYVDPVSDVETINLELVLHDQETVQKRIDSLLSKKGQEDSNASKRETHLLTDLLAKLNCGHLVSNCDLKPDDLDRLKSLHLLTAKPILYVLNKKEGSYNLDDNQDERFRRLLDKIDEAGGSYVVIDAGLELTLKDVDETDRLEFRREYGAPDSGLGSLVSKAYETLGLISFYTTGQKETKAWTVPRGATAPEAAGVIHTDFQTGFICAHISSFDDLVRATSLSKVREEGKLRVEGKDYQIRSGDVIEFMHS